MTCGSTWSKTILENAMFWAKEGSERKRRRKVGTVRLFWRERSSGQMGFSAASSNEAKKKLNKNHFSSSEDDERGSDKKIRLQLERLQVINAFVAVDQTHCIMKDSRLQMQIIEPDYNQGKFIKLGLSRCPLFTQRARTTNCLRN